MTLPKLTIDDELARFNVLDEEGVSHDGLNGWCAHYLGFCGCGAPDGVLERVLGLLSCIEQRADLKFNSDEDRLLSEQMKRLAPTEGEHEDFGWLLFYVLDHKGLTNHGTTARWPFLTEDGREFLARLRAWKSRDLPTSTPEEKE